MGSEVALANVSAGDVRDVIHLASGDIGDNVVAKMIKRAEITLELETNVAIDSADCTDAEKEFITVLAAIYAICYLTGGSAVGLNFSIGDENISVVSNAPPLSILQSEVERILSGLKRPSFRSVDRIEE